MNGTRRDRPDGSLPEPGEYGRGPDGKWQCRPPVQGLLVGNLSAHTVLEHEDGTITVYPSILISLWNGACWHGYIERGVWRQVA